MNKQRLESLSDGVFAIVMTLLVIEFRLPESSTDMTVTQELRAMMPVFFSYAVSFVVLDMFWVAHNALFNIFTKNINRIMIQINMLYLALMAFVPFSAHMLGSHLHAEAAVVLYGVNIFLLGIVNYAMLRYALVSDEIDTAHVSERNINQATIRMVLTPVMTAIGIAVAFVSIPTALFLYAFPVAFNIIPGLLDRMESAFGLDFGEKEAGK